MMNSAEFFNGEAFDAYTYFGAHSEGKGVTFRVYAPNAQDVKLEGDFSKWQEYNMYPCEVPGVYQAYIEGAKPGMYYKYVVYTKAGDRVEHSDPYGFAMELRPKWASIIVDLDAYEFQDEAWMQEKRDRNYNRPMNIYEFYPGSFRQK